MTLCGLYRPSDSFLRSLASDRKTLVFFTTFAKKSPNPGARRRRRMLFCSRSPSPNAPSRAQQN